MAVSHSLRPLADYSILFIAATSSHLVIVISTACHTASVFLYKELSYYALRLGLNSLCQLHNLLYKIQMLSDCSLLK
jgi:hypothetical protein